MSVDAWWMLDVGTSQISYQAFGGWSLVESPSTASPGSRFRLDTRGDCQDVPAEGGFNFGDVSQSHLKAVAAQVEHDAPNWEYACVRISSFLFFFAMSTVVHFTLLRTVSLVFGKFEPRDYALARWERSCGRLTCPSVWVEQSGWFHALRARIVGAGQ